MTIIVIKGPLLPDEIRRIAALMQDIESMRPDETFELYVDMPEVVDDALTARMAAAMTPPPLPGYKRTSWKLQETDAVVTEADVPDEEVEQSRAWVTCEDCGFGDEAWRLTRNKDGAWLCWLCAREEDR